jgi:hypothetical protein
MSESGDTSAPWAGHLGLDQELPADAAVDIFFLADLYRAVQLEAGIIGGRLYLAAYAQRLGATGLTFYDDEVTRFFSPHAEGKSAFSWWLSARVPNGGNSGLQILPG